MAFVRVRPLMSAWARRAEDLTFDKIDDKGAVLITRLAAQLRCYLPKPADETWARLPPLGIRRARLVAESVSQVQQMRSARVRLARGPERRPAGCAQHRPHSTTRASSMMPGRVRGTAPGAWSTVSCMISSFR
jgi:hypothetical protein